jgi:F-type H+-transporting ATPase subunit b
MLRPSLRTCLTGALLLAGGALPAAAQQEGGGRVNLLTPNGGLMFWTIIIFAVLLFVLSRYAFRPMLAAVEAREHSLQRALDEARASREEAMRVLADHRQQLEAARGEAQRLIAEGRATAEQVRTDLLEQTRAQQQEMMERARRDIETEKTNAIADLRREAVDLAIAGASKVIERNLDSQADRKLVETFLGSLQLAGKR